MNEASKVYCPAGAVRENVPLSSVTAPVMRVPLLSLSEMLA